MDKASGEPFGKHARIYVAGSGGMVGSALVRALNARGYANLVLRSHAHTPAWILQSRADGAIDEIVESFGDLARML